MLNTIQWEFIGNVDWAVFRVGPNANTGLSPFQAQGDFFRPFNGGISDGSQVTITGYGADDGVDNSTLQTHSGEIMEFEGNQIKYIVDTQGGNSGSPIIFGGPNGDVSYGIHYGGACNNVSGYNVGISFGYSSLNSAMNSLYSNNFGFVANYITYDGIGTVFQPWRSVEIMHNNASSNISENIVIVKGTYDETDGLILTKPILIHAPVGDVLIK